MRFKQTSVSKRSKRRQSNSRKNARQRGPRSRRLMCELLEDRRVLSGITDSYPEIPGMVLVDPRPDQFEGQIIFLDFDSAEDVTYNGPVTVGPFDVPAFEVPGDLAGQEQQIIADVVAQLETTFAGTGVVFTTTQPDPGNAHSTVFVGGDNTAFGEYGAFLGLSETVDIANQNKNDEAFVFTAELGPFGSSVVAADALADTIAHEVGHVLGYAHVDLSNPVSSTGALHQYAYTDGTVIDRGYVMKYANSYYEYAHAEKFGFKDLVGYNKYYRGYAWVEFSGIPFERSRYRRCVRWT